MNKLSQFNFLKIISLDKIINVQIHKLNIIILKDNISKLNSIKILLKLKLKQKFTENIKKRKNHNIRFIQ